MSDDCEKMSISLKNHQTFKFCKKIADKMQISLKNWGQNANLSKDQGNNVNYIKRLCKKMQIL